MYTFYPDPNKDPYDEVIKYFETEIESIMEIIRRDDIFTEEKDLDRLRSAIEEVAYEGRKILKKAEHLRKLDELVLDIADELSGFPDNFNYNMVSYLDYVGDRLEEAVHIYRNVVYDLPEDRKTYCAWTDELYLYGPDEGFLEEARASRS